MRANHLTSTSRALYNVFVLPSLSKTQPKLQTSRQLNQPITPRHNFSTTQRNAVKTRAPEVRTEKWDEEIKSRQIYIVDPVNNRLSERPMTRYDVLSRMDRTTHRLIQVGEAPIPGSDPNDPFSDPNEADTIPVCKIMSKKDSYLNDQKKKAEAKEKKRLSNITSSVKTLELNWAIDGNDLGHRLEKMKGFLEEGRKVEIVLAAKKKGRKASPGECEDVLRRIRDAVEAVEGAKEEKALQGGLGVFSTMQFSGRPVKVQKAREDG